LNFIIEVIMSEVKLDTLTLKDRKLISAIEKEDTNQIELLIKDDEIDISFALTTAIFTQKKNAFAILLKYSTDQDIENALLAAKETIDEIIEAK